MIQKISDQYKIPIIAGGQAVKMIQMIGLSSVGQNLPIAKILKILQSKKPEIIPTV